MLNYVSIALSLFAVALTGFMYADQRDANALTRERYERRYVERVSMWEGVGKDAGFAFIQNRAPVPLPEVEVGFRQRIFGSGDGGTRYIRLLSGVKPCNVTKVKLPKLASPASFIEYIYFVDGDGRWWKKGVYGTKLIYNTERTGDEAPGDEWDGIIRHKNDYLDVISEVAVEDCTDA